MYMQVQSSTDGKMCTLYQVRYRETESHVHHGKSNISMGLTAGL